MKSQNIQELLTETAARFSGQIAINHNGRQWRYGELEERSNEIANAIKAAGYRTGSVIGVLVEDRMQLIAAITGILKSGCAFMPLNAAEPIARLQAMCNLTRPALFLADAAILRTISPGLLLAANTPVLVLDELGDEIRARLSGLTFLSGRGGKETPDYQAEGDDICYIFFTSGSTGVPKAIAGRYKSLLHFIQWEIKTLGVTDQFKITHLANPTFDACLRDIFVPLCSGATICIPQDRSLMLEPARLMDWIEQMGITLMHCVPAVFRLLTRESLDPRRMPSLRYIMMAGEKLYPAEIQRWMDVFGERIQLINLYGATENTMAKFFHFITPSDTLRSTIPIGKPMAGARAILLDENGRVCDPGEVGEIHIRTPYLTLGYYNNPDLTRKVFIQNPFNSDPKDVIYKSGDYGRLLPDGNYELIGRKDNQVKIRGQRAELTEIEHFLKLDKSIHDCVVALWGEDPDDQRVAAYLVPQPGLSIDLSSLQISLRSQLPEYLIPASFTILEALPLTPNGKVDRKALPRPEQTSITSEIEFVAPRGEMEEMVASIWREILQIERVGIHDNFFQLGGHSLLATQMVSRIREGAGVDLPVRTVFERPTIAGLGAAIAELKSVDEEKTQTQVLDQIEQMSEEEIQMMILQLSGAGQPDASTFRA